MLNQSDEEEFKISSEQFDALSSDDQRRFIRLLRERNKRLQGFLKNYVPTTIQTAILRSKAKIVLIPGGNRGGKSDTGALIVGVSSTNILPDAILNDGHDYSYLMRNGLIWCSALDFSGTRDIIKEKLDTLIPSSMIDRYNAEEKIYYFKDGNPRSKTPKIGLKSQESGEDKYQGTSRIIIWLDEEHKKKVFDECYERTVDCQGRIILTFSPIKGLTWSHNDLYKLAGKVYFTKNTLGLKEESGAVHTVEEIRNMQNSRELQCRVSRELNARENIEVYIITKYDNPHLDPEEIRNAEIKYQFDPNQYNARILGRYTRIEGNCVFPTDAVVLQQQRVPTKFQVGEIKNNKFQPVPSGSFTMFDEPKPGHFYVVGADWGQGIANGDNTVFSVFDHITRKQVAEWVGRVSPEFGARILTNVGYYYNKALLVPESNGIGVAAVLKIKELKYPNLFTHYSLNHDMQKGGNPKQKTYGFRTGHDTKPKMEQDLVEALRLGNIHIASYEACEELLSYIYHEEGNIHKTGAKPGCKDDRAISIMLALQGIRRKNPNQPMDRDFSATGISDPMTGY